METKAGEFDVDLIGDPITDEGETGTNFDRAGIKRVFRLAASGEISYVLVDHISRIGRNAPETLYYIYVLRDDCDVKIITTTNGLRNVSQVQDLIQMSMQALISHMSTQYRARSALRSWVRGFVEERNWSSWYNQVPLAYSATDDDWITPDRDEAEVVEAMFDHFLETEPYTATEDALNDRFGDDLDEPVDYRQVKRTLQRRVYIGRPTIDPGADTEDRAEVVDPHLLLVDPGTFEEVQSVIEGIAAENTTDEKTIDVETAIDEFGLFPVVNVIPIVQLICRDCGGEFRYNGQRELDGSYSAHNLQCKKCGRQRKFPYQRELKYLKAI